MAREERTDFMRTRVTTIAAARHTGRQESGEITRRGVESSDGLADTVGGGAQYGFYRALEAEGETERRLDALRL